MICSDGWTGDGLCVTLRLSVASAAEQAFDEGVHVGDGGVGEAATDLSGQAGQRGSAVGDARQLGAGGAPLGGRGGGPLPQRDQRLQRDEPARAVVVGRHQRAGQRARVQLRAQTTASAGSAALRTS